jgi:hypothetical protein
MKVGNIKLLVCLIDIAEAVPACCNAMAAGGFSSSWC